MDYYADLQTSDDPARRAGWLRRVGQVFRFECVRQLWDRRARIVDLGCGDASLARYLGDSGRPVNYLGIDVRRQSTEGLPAHAEILCQDFLETRLEPSDFVVCLGGLVDGQPRVQADMRFRAEALLDRMMQANRGLLLSVDLDGIPDWRSDPALSGIRADWFTNTPVSFARVSRDEIAVYWGGGLDLGAARRSVAAGAWAPWDPAELAWLAHRSGESDEAHDWLSQPGILNQPLAELVRERLELES